MSEVGTIANSKSPSELGTQFTLDWALCNEISFVGALAPGCRVKIVGESGDLLGPNEVGEIFCYTPAIMNGKRN